MHVVSLFYVLHRLCKAIRVDDSVADNPVQAAVHSGFDVDHCRAFLLLPVNGVVFPFGIDLLLRKLSDLPPLDGLYVRHLHHLMQIFAVVAELLKDSPAAVIEPLVAFYDCVVGMVARMVKDGIAAHQPCLVQTVICFLKMVEYVCACYLVIYRQ